MINEIGAGVGGALTFGGAVAMFKFLNAKIDKKQDKALCKEIAKTFDKGIDRINEDHDKAMEILGKIQVATGKIEQELLNNKT